MEWLISLTSTVIAGQTGRHFKNDPVWLTMVMAYENSAVPLDGIVV